MLDWLGQLLGQTEAVHFWPVLAACAIVSVGAFQRSVGYWRSSRLLEDIPPSRTRSAAQGYVQLVGTIQNAPDLPTSPVNGTRVAWWSLTSQSMPRGRSKNASGLLIGYVIVAFFFKRMSIHNYQESRRPFEIKDEFGSCEIEPHGVTVITGNEQILYGASSTEISPHARVNGITPPTELRLRDSGWLESDERHIYQWLAPGERVYAIGEFASTHVQEAESVTNTNVDKDGAAILQQWQKNNQKLLDQFDHDANGSLDENEWTLIRRAAMVEARLRAARRTRGRVLNRLRKPATGGEFLVVSLDDPALGPALRRRSVGWLALFFGLGTLVVWAFNVRLGLSA